MILTHTQNDHYYNHIKNNNKNIITHGFGNKIYAVVVLLDVDTVDVSCKYTFVEI